MFPGRRATTWATEVDDAIFDRPRRDSCLTLRSHPRFLIPGNDDAKLIVARGGARKLANLRRRPWVTMVFRSGWEWVAVEGNADLAGPDDALQGLDASDMPELLREIYAAAEGGSPDDWVDLDPVIAAEGHTADLVRALRIYSNPGPQ